MLLMILYRNTQMYKHLKGYGTYAYFTTIYYIYSKIFKIIIFYAKMIYLIFII